MHRFADDESALSEIVGALMLVLVVVVAAGSFGAFFLSNQKRQQQVEEIQKDRAAERVEIPSVVPVGSGASWDTLTFRLSNPSDVAAIVTGFTIADVHVLKFTLLKTDGSTLGTEADYEPWVAAGTPSARALKLVPFDQVAVRVDMTDGTAFFGGAAPTLAKTEPVEFAVGTERLNSFDKAFLPPTAVPIYTAPEADPNILHVDGSESQQPTPGGFIVTWKWTVGGTGCTGSASGKVVRLTVTAAPTTTCTVTLTVTDNFGMQATDSFEYVTS